MTRTALLAAVALSLSAVMWAALHGLGPINYDTSYSLLWGEQLASGLAVDRDAPVAPTPKPMLVLIGVLPGSDDLHDVFVVVLALLGLGGLAVACAGISWTLAGSWAGALAAVVTLTREPVLSFGLRSYADVPFSALVLGAVLAAMRGTQDRVVLALLAGAGLLRPEAWALSAGWLVWRWRTTGEHRATLVALALVGPVSWMSMDLVLSGSPLDSWTSTRGTAAELDRTTGLAGVALAPRRIGEIVREPVLLALLPGLVLLLRHRGRPTTVLGAAAGTLTVAFVVLCLAGLPALGRYLLPLAALGCAVGAAGAIWVVEQIRISKTALALVGVLVLTTAATLPAQISRLSRLDQALAAQARAVEDLRVVADRDLRRAPCGPVRLPDHRLQPLLSRRLDLPGSAFARGDARGVIVAPASRGVVRALLIDPRDPPAAKARVIATAPAVASSSFAWNVRIRCGR